MTYAKSDLKTAARDALLRTNFSAFAWKVFTSLNQGRDEPYVHNWHIDAVCHILEEARLGRAPKTVINLPPRHSKSTIAAVAYTAWILGHKPKSEILVASHTQRLAKLHSEATRAVMDSEWYRGIFPRTGLTPSGGASELRTTAGGSRMSVTAGVATMGFGADVIIIDDLLDAMEARSEAERDKVTDYIDNALLTRLNDPASGIVVCIHQRIHENDPAGHLLNTGAFNHLNLPAIAEVDEEIATGPGKTFLREKGTALFPQRFGLAALEAVRKERGPNVFQMLYQQNPIAQGGSALRWDWFGTYDEPLPREQYELVVQSWDTANSGDPGNAFSVCTTWGLRGRHWHLLDVFREHLEYPALKRACLRLAETWQADKVLIEKAASGIHLLSELFEKDRRRYEAILPKLDKEVRFNAACSLVEEGIIFLPRDALWLAAFKRELQGFPRATHKDQADSFSQFLNWAKGVGFWRALGREHPLARERHEEQMRRREEQRRHQRR